MEDFFGRRYFNSPQSMMEDYFNPSSPYSSSEDLYQRRNPFYSSSDRRNPFYNPFSSSEDFGRRNPYNNSSQNRHRSREIPVKREFEVPITTPKVVSIPVHNNVRKNVTKSEAVVRIQKVFRGNVVRKKVKEVLGIKKEVDEIEKNFFEFVEKLREDEKERLKVNEMLMRLLFKLDSIIGIDSGIRELRKSVIKKAIMLQERLDSIVAEEEENQESVDQEGVGDEEQKWDIVSELDETNAGEELGQEGSNCDGEVEKQENLDREVIEEEEDVRMEIDCKQEEKNGDNGMKELMEKMVENNDMLVKMVADLCEKNKVQRQVNHMQAKLMNSLLKRVDNLEKSFRDERSKSKKQRKPGAGSLDDYKKP